MSDALFDLGSLTFRIPISGLGGRLCRIEPMIVKLEMRLQHLVALIFYPS